MNGATDAPITTQGVLISYMSAGHRGVMGETYTYGATILDALAHHGLRPLRHTPPQQLRDAVRDLYKYEIRRLRGELLAGRIPKPEYAGHVVELRKRYGLLSIPIELWTM